MPDAILGNYSDFKLVKTRSCVQVIIEVPIERAHEVTDLLGLPLPGAEIPVAIARINLSKVEPTQIEHANDEPDKPPRPLSQIAAILCNIVAFRRFLVEECEAPEPQTPEAAADFVRNFCGVASRRELDTYAEGAAAFKRLRASYDVWMRAPA